MSFQDEIRKNYVPKKKDKPDFNYTDFRNSLSVTARGCLSLAKGDLLREAKKGNVKPSGILGFGKCVSVCVQVYVDKTRYKRAEIRYNDDEKEYGGLGVPNKMTLYLLFNEVRNQARADGIRVEFGVGYDNRYYEFTFRAKV